MVLFLIGISAHISYIRSYGLAFPGLFSPKSHQEREPLINTGSITFFYTWRQNLIIPALNSQHICFGQVSRTKTKFLLIHCMKKTQAYPVPDLKIMSLTLLSSHTLLPLPGAALDIAFSKEESTFFSKGRK